MNNFWNRSNKTNGSLFGKSSAPAPDPTPPPPAPQPAAKQSSAAMKSTVSNISVPASSKTLKAADPNAAKVKFDHDFACGVFVGAFDIPNLEVTIEQVEVKDPVTGRIERIDQWLRTNDMLAILTREYGKAQKRLASLPPPPPALPGRPANTKDWDDANRRLTEVRDQVVCVLHSRRAYHRAKEQGIRILIEV